MPCGTWDPCISQVQFLRGCVIHMKFECHVAFEVHASAIDTILARLRDTQEIRMPRGFWNPSIHQPGTPRELAWIPMALECHVTFEILPSASHSSRGCVIQMKFESHVVFEIHSLVRQFLRGCVILMAFECHFAFEIYQSSRHMIFSNTTWG
jgi:hypothetical protein